MCLPKPLATAAVVSPTDPHRAIYSTTSVSHVNFQSCYPSVCAWKGRERAHQSHADSVVSGRHRVFRPQTAPQTDREDDEGEHVERPNRRQERRPLVVAGRLVNSSHDGLNSCRLHLPRRVVCIVSLPTNTGSGIKLVRGGSR